MPPIYEVSETLINGVATSVTTHSHAGVDSVNISHGDLLNLSADDHTQYLLDSTYTSPGSVDPGHEHSGLCPSGGGSRVVIVDALGNVGVNTGTPDKDFQIVGTMKIGEDTTNFAEFESDGTLKLNGTATGWEDLRVAVTSTKLGGTKDPGFAVFKTNGAGSQGVFLYWFDAAAEEELYFVVQLPHSWARTAITPHVHWVPATNSDGVPANQTVEWGLEYTWANIGGVFSNTSIVYGKAHLPADADVVAGKHYVTNLTAITPGVGTQDGISSMIACRIFRNATDAVDDTYEQDAGLLEIDFHYEIDTIGSRTIGSK